MYSLFDLCRTSGNELMYCMYSKQNRYLVPGTLLVEQVAEHLWDEETIDLASGSAAGRIFY